MCSKEEIVHHVVGAFVMPDFRYFINKQTGEVNSIPGFFAESYVDMDKYSEFYDYLKANSNNFVEIPPVPTEQDIAIIENFIDNLDNKEKKNELIAIFQETNILNAFLKKIHNNDELLERWYDYKDNYYLKLAENWLKKECPDLYQLIST